jgi:hypothetical protein
LFSKVGPEVEDFPAHVLAGEANSGSNDFAGAGFKDFNPRF